MRYMESIIIILIIVCLTGCTLPNQTPDQTLEQRAYVAGRLTAAVYLDTQAVQPAQVKQAAQISYAVLRAVNASGTTCSLGAVIAREVDKTVSQADSALFRELVASQVSAAQAKLLSSVGGVGDSLTILAAFQSGIDDVLNGKD